MLGSDQRVQGARTTRTKARLAMWFDPNGRARRLVAPLHQKFRLVF